MTSLLRLTWVVLRKELVDGIRDRRSVMSALIPPIMWPLMILVMMNFIAEKRSKADDIKIPIVGAQHAETLVTWLKQQRGVEVVDPRHVAERPAVDRWLVPVDPELPQAFHEVRERLISPVRCVGRRPRRGPGGSGY